MVANATVTKQDSQHQDSFVPRMALLSVSDKTGIVRLGSELVIHGCRLLSTGGTGRVLDEQGVAFQELAEHTNHPEIMDGRVKSLHPKVFGGILSRRNEDSRVVAKLGISEIDVVVANLYPFAETIADPDCDMKTVLENIDVGGPAMIRAAAKNWFHVLVVVDTSDYSTVIQRLKTGEIDSHFRRTMATKAFRYTTEYDATIASYLDESEDLPEKFQFSFGRKATLRYGENPHQRAAFYVSNDSPEGSIANARQLQGKELSYNNIADADAALECVTQFDEPTCVIVKHGNPCGVATSDEATSAYLRAFETDQTSAFGGIIALNVPLELNTLKKIIDSQFSEVIVAPKISESALLYAQRRKNIRLLEIGCSEKPTSEFRLKQVSGGLLVQDDDNAILESQSLKYVTSRHPNPSEHKDLRFGWKVAKFVKSNAIVISRDQQTLGIGAGQMNRVSSVRIAVSSAKERGFSTKGAVLASDAFFPFRDGVDFAATEGISAAIQPGGSVRDAEVIEAANEHGISMVFTGIRHFRH